MDSMTEMGVANTPKLCPMGRLQDKFGAQVSNLFFSYYSKPSDDIDLGLVPKLNGPGHLWVDPDNDFNAEVKLTPPTQAELKAALTHERILLEGERVIERIAKVFIHERNEALRLQKASTVEQFKLEISKINESIRTFQKNEKLRHDMILEITVECIKEKLANAIARAVEKISVKHANELKNYVHKNDVEEIKKKCNESIQKALHEQKVEIMRSMPFLVENETKEVKEIMEIENERREKKMKKALDMERGRLDEKLRQLEADHTDELLQVIATERLDCWLNSLKNEPLDSKSDHSEMDRKEAEIKKLECVIVAKNKEIDKLKTKAKTMVEEMKALVACQMNQPLSQIEYLFPRKQAKCPPVVSRFDISQSSVSDGSSVKGDLTEFLRAKLSQDLSKPELNFLNFLHSKVFKAV